MRTEHDMLGTRSLSDDTLYGLQTLRAKENFITSYHTTNLSLIYAMVQVKKAAALSYRELHRRNPKNGMLSSAPATGS